MISRAQQVLIKRGQREAGLDDPEYRHALEAATGCRSSRDPELTDRGVDLVMAYMEAIAWRRADAGELQLSSKPFAVFRQRGYWASKNPRQNTSRDRFNGGNLSKRVTELEGELAAMGFGAGYCAGIRAKVIGTRNDDQALYLYRTALERTLRAKRRKASADVANEPF